MNEVRSVQGSALELRCLCCVPSLSDGVVEMTVVVEVSNRDIEAGIIIAIVLGEAQLLGLQEETGED